MAERESSQEEWIRKENEKLEAHTERQTKLGHEATEPASTVEAMEERQIRLGHVVIDHREEKPKSKPKPRKPKETTEPEA